jgi:phosphatidylserine/phosphatidylglycerophosphate/cardiolipin synthase-like enzyme
MLRILSSDLWSEIGRLTKRRGVRRAAVAYVSTDVPVAFRVGDKLIVNASDDAIRAGQTSAAVLSAAFSQGAALFSNPNLHAKVLVVGGVAVVSSANLSQSSREVLHEIGIVTDDPEIVGGATQFVEQLAQESIRMDASFIERIRAIPVVRRRHVGTKGRQKRVHVRGGRTWILGLSEDPVYPGKQEEVERINESVTSEAERGEEVDWFWWSGKRSRFLHLAKVGDRIISLYRPRQSDKSTRTVRVYRHCVIKRIFRERGCSATTYHIASRSDAEKTRLSWSRFLVLAKKAGVRGRFSVDSAREIPSEQSTALHTLWGQLGQ